MTLSEQRKAEQLNAQIQIEINSNQINIDRAIFIKTKAEKQQLKDAKILSNIKNKKLKDEFISSLLSSNPRFGSLKFIFN